MLAPLRPTLPAFLVSEQLVGRLLLVEMTPSRLNQLILMTTKISNHDILNLYYDYNLNKFIFPAFILFHSLRLKVKNGGYTYEQVQNP